MLDAATLREMLAKLLTPSSRRQAVTWAIAQKAPRSGGRSGWSGSRRRPTAIARAVRRCTAARRLRELAERRRFGYRRLLILLRREGVAINHNAVPALSRGTAGGAQAAAASGHRHAGAD